MHTKLIAGAVLLALAAPAQADDWDFVLVNKTGKSIKLVELSEAGSGNWSKERVEEDRPSDIGPGDDHTVHFAKAAKSCVFDVRLTYADGSTEAFPALNVCTNAFAEFAYKNGAPSVKGS